MPMAESTSRLSATTSPPAGRAVLACRAASTADERAAHFQIRSIPTLMVFRDQIIVFSQPGALPRNALEQVVSRAKTLDMEEVRQEIAKQESQGAGSPPPAA